MSQHIFETEHDGGLRKVFAGALVDLGLVIPKEMIDEIVADGKVDIGNKVVEHSNEGEYKRKQLY